MRIEEESEVVSRGDRPSRSNRELKKEKNFFSGVNRFRKEIVRTGKKSLTDHAKLKENCVVGVREKKEEGRKTRKAGSRSFRTGKFQLRNALKVCSKKKKKARDINRRNFGEGGLVSGEFRHRVQ